MFVLFDFLICLNNNYIFIQLIKKRTTRQCDLSLQQLIAKHEQFKARQDEIINKQKYEIENGIEFLFFY